MTLRSRSLTLDLGLSIVEVRKITSNMVQKVRKMPEQSKRLRSFRLGTRVLRLRQRHQQGRDSFPAKKEHFRRRPPSLQERTPEAK